MGIIADIFVSNNEEALKYGDSQLGDYTLRISKYNPIELRNLTDLNFSTLWALLENEEWDIDNHELEEIDFASDGESWLFKFPDKLCILLSSLNSARSQPLAEAWAKTDELKMSRWSTSDAFDVISKLVNSCKEAVSKNLGVYLWGSV